MEPYELLLLHIPAIQSCVFMLHILHTAHLICSHFPKLDLTTNKNIAPANLPFTCLSPDILNYSVFSEDIMVPLAPGSLHILIPLPGMPFPCPSWNLPFLPLGTASQRVLSLTSHCQASLGPLVIMISSKPNHRNPWTARPSLKAGATPVYSWSSNIQHIIV